jgi:hypothetical protein
MRLTVLITVVRHVLSEYRRLCFGHEFFLPFLFPFSSHRKTCWPLQKKKERKNIEVLLFVCWVKLSPYYFDCHVLGLELFIELIFFQSHPLIFDFYIKFGSHSFNCNVFGLESLLNYFFNFIP